MSRLRKDPASARWVVFPDAGGSPSPSPSPVAAEASTPPFCPFCPGAEDKTPHELFAFRESGSHANERGWRLRVVPNRFPVLQPEGAVQRHGDGIYDRMSGVGVHEIVIEHPEHGKRFGDYDVDHAELVVRAWAERYHALSDDPRIRFVMLFRNRGAASSLEPRPHVCSELIALPLLPRRIDEELKRARHHWEWKERCLFCDQIRAELDGRRRLVAHNEFFVAFCPFAARSPFEVQIHPRRHQSDFRMMGSDEARALAAILVDVHARLDRRAPSTPLAMLLHGAPSHAGELAYYHWHIECLPEMAQISAFEWATGFYLNPAPPEISAEILRGADHGKEEDR